MSPRQPQAAQVARLIRHLDGARATVTAIEFAAEDESPEPLLQRLVSDITGFVTELASAPPISEATPAVGGTTALCVCQLRKCVPLLSQAMRPGAAAESKGYVCARMRHCLVELGTHVTAPVDASPPTPPGSRFVRAMDAAMDAAWALAESADPALLGCAEATSCAEAALQHAMTVAQVARPQDLRDISRASRKILAAQAALSSECCAGANAGVCRLLASALGDALAALEQQVNNAVLRLFLQVFSSPGAELRALVEAALGPSGSDLEPTDLEPVDLEPLVVELDLATDRVMQVGLFAVACSGDSKRRLATRSCLASLESLEPELVPAASGQRASRRRHLAMLASHWLAEMGQLRLLVDGILDSAAFCQVATEEAAAAAARAKRALADPTPSDAIPVTTAAAQCAIRCGVAVLRHLDVAAPKPGAEVEDAARRLRLACAECKACLRLATEEGGDTKLTEPTNPWCRLAKRCQLVVTSLRRLQPPLRRLMDDSAAPDPPPPEQSAHDWSPVGDACDPLTPFVTAGRTLRKERGVLYTPQTTGARTPLSVAGLRNAVRIAPKVLTSRGAVPTPRGLTSRWATRRLFQTSAAEDETLGLDITAVLDELTRLSGTLTSYCEAADLLGPLPTPISPSLTLSQAETCITDADSSCNVATWERLEDLSKLGHRLDQLRLGNASQPST